jgi:hypothetical protein
LPLIASVASGTAASGTNSPFVGHQHRFRFFLGQAGVVDGVDRGACGRVARI